MASKLSDPANIARLQTRFLKCLLRKKNAIVAAVYKNLTPGSQNQSGQPQDVYSAMFIQQPDHHIAFISNYIFNEILGCLKNNLRDCYKSGEYWALKQLNLEKSLIHLTVEQSLSKSYDLVKAANVRVATKAYTDSQLKPDELKSAIEKAITESFKAIAATESLRQKVAGAVDALKKNGVTKAAVMAEYRTAGDNHVCPTCEAYERKVLPLDEIKALIPQHPNCRCWFSVVGEDESDRTA